MAILRPIKGSSLTCPNVCHSLKNCSGEIMPSLRPQRVGGRPLLRRRNAGLMLAAFSLARKVSGSLTLFIACGRPLCKLELRAHQTVPQAAGHSQPVAAGSQG